MDEQITAIIGHMSNSHAELANLLEVKKDMVVHMSRMVLAIPDTPLTFSGVDTITENSVAITESITDYLNRLADLEEALAENLTYVMKQLHQEDEE
jgi:hypothetical protein